MTSPEQSELTPTRQRLVLVFLLAAILVIAAVVAGANLVFKNPHPYTEMSFSNPDDAKAELPGALISSTEWGDSRGWIVWTQEGHKDAARSTLRTSWFGSEKCYWVSTDENRVQSFDPEPDNSCNPKNIPNLKVPRSVAEAAVARMSLLTTNLEKDLKGVPSNRVPFALTTFVIQNWGNVASPTNILQPDNGTFVYYLPVRDVPVKELTASGTGTQPITDACLVVTATPVENTVSSAETC